MFEFCETTTFHYYFLLLTRLHTSLLRRFCGGFKPTPTVRNGKTSLRPVSFPSRVKHTHLFMSHHRHDVYVRVSQMLCQNPFSRNDLITATIGTNLFARGSWHSVESVVPYSAINSLIDDEDTTNAATMRPTPSIRTPTIPTTKLTLKPVFASPTINTLASLVPSTITTSTTTTTVPTINTLAASLVPSINTISAEWGEEWSVDLILSSMPSEKEYNNVVSAAQVPVGIMKNIATSPPNKKKSSNLFSHHPPSPPAEKEEKGPEKEQEQKKTHGIGFTRRDVRRRTKNEGHFVAKEKSNNNKNNETSKRSTVMAALRDLFMVVPPKQKTTDENGETVGTSRADFSN